MTNQTSSEMIREIWASSGLSYCELSKIVGIAENTLACWISGRRNPPHYVVEYVKMKLALSSLNTNEDIIRNLSKNDLADLLELVSTNGFGKRTALEFLEGTDLRERYRV